MSFLGGQPDGNVEFEKFFFETETRGRAQQYDNLYYPPVNAPFSFTQTVPDLIQPMDPMANQPSPGMGSNLSEYSNSPRSITQSESPEPYKANEPLLETGYHWPQNDEYYNHFSQDSDRFPAIPAVVSDDGAYDSIPMSLPPQYPSKSFEPTTSNDLQIPSLPLQSTHQGFMGHYPAAGVAPSQPMAQVTNSPGLQYGIPGRYFPAAPSLRDIQGLQEDYLSHRDSFSANQRRRSMQSLQSAYSEGATSMQSLPSSCSEGGEKRGPPCTECGKHYKDMKAHTNTHQAERPEKCPVEACEYKKKGFARKYDRNRHVLSHYKAGFTCNFCEGSEPKSFNRLDIMKKHMYTVHGVEPNAPNSRKRKSVSAAPAHGHSTGEGADDSSLWRQCDVCRTGFSSAQHFHDHLEDCVSHYVRQQKPTEAVNVRRLAEVENDPAVLDTLQRNNLIEMEPMEDEDARHDDDDDVESTMGSATASKIKGKPDDGGQKSRGMKHSRDSASLSRNKKRKIKHEVPASWDSQNREEFKRRSERGFSGPQSVYKQETVLNSVEGFHWPLGNHASDEVSRENMLSNGTTGNGVLENMTNMDVNGTFMPSNHTTGYNLEQLEREQMERRYYI